MSEKSKYLDEFKKLYQQKNSVELSDELALEYFEKLTLLVSVIYKPKQEHGNGSRTI